MDSADLDPRPEWTEDITTVGVTGTNGKTTTTTFVSAALRAMRSPVARVTTLGRFLDDERLAVPPGYPGFLETFRRAHERGGRFGAIELTSEALAMGFARTWPCRVGVFTNLSRDHFDAHGSAEHYLASKAQLFVQLPKEGTAVLNARDSASELLTHVLPEGVVTSTYGVSSRGDAWCKANVEATSTTVSWSGTEISLDWRSDARPANAPARLRISAIGDVFAENALAALLAAIAMGVDAERAALAIADCPPPEGRFEVVAHEPYVVVDYAHTPDALERLIATARKLMKGDGKVTIIFGAGGDRDQGKRPGMGAACSDANAVVLTTDNPRSEDPRAIAASIQGGIPKGIQVHVDLDRARAITNTIQGAGCNDIILLAGKGHEKSQLLNGLANASSDAGIARAAHSAR